MLSAWAPGANGGGVAHFLLPATPPTAGGERFLLLPGLALPTARALLFSLPCFSFREPFFLAWLAPPTAGALAALLGISRFGMAFKKLVEPRWLLLTTTRLAVGWCWGRPCWRRSTAACCQTGHWTGGAATACYCPWRRRCLSSLLES